MTDLRGVTPAIAAHVLWVFDRPLGRRPGRFIACLIDAVVCADDQNRDLLAVAYPGYVRAVRGIQHREDGVLLLQRIAADPVGGES